jgi:chorismate synthase
MAGDSLGQSFRITNFGESHGAGLGVVIEGCPPKTKIKLSAIQKDLDRRKPGQSKITTQRKEADEVEILSGVLGGLATGTPISLLIRNTNQHSSDYNNLKDLFRPSHADFTYESKYGIRDVAGGGRSSARVTAGTVAAGAIAKEILQTLNKIKIVAYVQSIKHINAQVNPLTVSESDVEKNIVRCPDAKAAAAMEKLILQARKKGDSVGGVITCVIQNVPAGWGEPIFDKLEADLAKAMMSINATKGFEIGSGFSGTKLFGSEHNDIFVNVKGKIATKTNLSGGIQGGISNGMPIIFNVAFKPTATLLKPQKTVNKKGEVVDYQARGRHDPCVLPRAVPIVEAMAALVLADHAMRQRALRGRKM